jgi:hypothetical protein
MWVEVAGTSFVFLAAAAPLLLGQVLFCERWLK